MSHRSDPGSPWARRAALAARPAFNCQGASYVRELTSKLEKERIDHRFLLEKERSHSAALERSLDEANARACSFEHAHDELQATVAALRADIATLEEGTNTWRQLALKAQVRSDVLS